MKKTIICVTLLLFAIFACGCHEHTLGYYSELEPEVDKDGIPWTFIGSTFSDVIDLHEEEGKVIGTIQYYPDLFADDPQSEPRTEDKDKAYMYNELDTYIHVLEEDHYKIEKLTVICSDRVYSISYCSENKEYTEEGFTER